MLGWLEKCGYTNITIIDNHSDYEPLLSFYKTCPHKTIRMDKNYGHTVFYSAPHFFWKRKFTFYILTDPDISLIEGCPNDFAEQFIRVMMDYPQYSKVGFSLKIDDLPDDYYLKYEVVAWESQFYQKPLENNDYSFKLYHAAVDTTFAFSSPSIYYGLGYLRFNAIRTGIPYQVRHLPWYITKSSSENEHYLKSIRPDITTWNGNRDKSEIHDMFGDYFTDYEQRNSRKDS